MSVPMKMLGISNRKYSIELFFAFDKLIDGYKVSIYNEKTTNCFCSKQIVTGKKYIINVIYM